MAQDIRELLRQGADFNTGKMRKGHTKRFKTKLKEAFPYSKKSFSGFNIAASVILLVSAGYITYRAFQSPGKEVTEIRSQVQENPMKTLTLGDISPDLKKVESYYVANINVALSELEISDENKPLIGSYMKQLTQLNDEYERLNHELNELGPNEQTVNALIGNLQLRLQLLYKLKEKLNQLNELQYENTLHQQT